MGAADSRSRQSGDTAKPGRTGKGNRYLRAALGQAVMAAARTDTRLGAMYRRIARRRGKSKAIVAVSRVICEIAWRLICDPQPGTKSSAPTIAGAARPADPHQDPRDRTDEPRQEGHPHRR